MVANGTTRDVDLGSHHGLSLEGETDVAGSDEEVAIVYTSAMEGTPLGAILTHRNLLANARSTIDAVGNSSDDRVLACLPFAHLFGLTAAASAPLLVGGQVQTMPRFNPARAAEMLAAGEITRVVGVPAVYRALLSALERKEVGQLADRLQLCICGGSPLEISLQDKWFDVTGVELREGYGLTEAGPVCLVNRHDRPNARGTLGTPLPGVDVRVAANGELLVRGENVFRGYVSGGERGLQVRDGWLHTGDRCHANPDGSYSFDGLLKPMFTRNGFNIYPHEIERAMAELPGIEQVTVREVPQRDAESNIAVYARGAVTVDDVRAWCAERLSAYKQPTMIEVRP